MLGTFGGYRTALTKPVRARTGNAVLHSRNHVKANEIFGGGRTHCCEHAVVVVDSVQGRDGRIIPAVIQDELAAASLEAAQVGISGVENTRGFLVRRAPRQSYVSRDEVPAWIIEYHVAEVVFHVDDACGCAGSSSP